MKTNLPPISPIPLEQLKHRARPRAQGRVTSVVGMVVEGSCPRVAVGDLIAIEPSGQAQRVLAEVIGIRQGSLLAIPLGDPRGVAGGDRIVPLGVSATVSCSNAMLGRVVDARGMVLDSDNGPLRGPFDERSLYADPPSPLSRRLIDTLLPVGVRAIDGLLSLGEGQRVGIMAGAGVGKSRLLAMLARGAACDVGVIALIGERGREVGEFLERVLDAETRQRFVTVVATSDQSPLERMRGAFTATAIAEHFSAQGKRVLLLMDSLTRFAMAQRELGLSVGEPPATRGYPPSVFALLPRLLERAGRFSHGGSITGLYTVLIEGDDLNDPVGDSARSILDGHIVLTRALASRGHFPAIDVLQSISRVIDSVLPPEKVDLARRMREQLALLREVEELQSFGAYTPGAQPHLDRVLQRKDNIIAFLRQAADSLVPFEHTVKAMTMLAGSKT